MQLSQRTDVHPSRLQSVDGCRRRCVGRDRLSARIDDELVAGSQMSQEMRSIDAQEGNRDPAWPTPA